jgi:hypothetical protein
LRSTATLPARRTSTAESPRPRLASPVRHVNASPTGYQPPGAGQVGVDRFWGLITQGTRPPPDRDAKVLVEQSPEQQIDRRPDRRPTARSRAVQSRRIRFERTTGPKQLLECGAVDECAGSPARRIRAGDPARSAAASDARTAEKTIEKIRGNPRTSARVRRAARTSAKPDVATDVNLSGSRSRLHWRARVDMTRSRQRVGHPSDGSGPSW